VEQSQRAAMIATIPDYIHHDVLRNKRFGDTQYIRPLGLISALETTVYVFVRERRSSRSDHPSEARIQEGEMTRTEVLRFPFVLGGSPRFRTSYAHCDIFNRVNRYDQYATSTVRSH
jgi:hypothetical protein